MGGRYDNHKENLCPHLAAFTGILGVMEPGGLVVPAYLAPGVRLQVAGPVGCNQRVNTLVRSTAQNTPICPTPGSWACRLQPESTHWLGQQHKTPLSVRLKVAGPVGYSQRQLTVNILVRSTAQNRPICPQCNEATERRTRQQQKRR